MSFFPGSREATTSKFSTDSFGWKPTSSAQQHKLSESPAGRDAPRNSHYALRSGAGAGKRGPVSTQAHDCTHSSPPGAYQCPSARWQHPQPVCLSHSSSQSTASSPALLRQPLPAPASSVRAGRQPLKPRWEPRPDHDKTHNLTPSDPCTARDEP